MQEGLASAARNCQNENAQSYPSKKTPHIHGAVRANIAVHVSAPHRPGPLLAFEGLVGYRRAGGAESPCSGHTDSRYDLEPRTLGSGDFDTTEDHCPRVTEPPLPLQPNVPYQPRFLFARARSRSMSVSASMVPPRKSPRRVRLALSKVPREPKASSLSRSLPTADRGATGNESSHRRAKHQMSGHHSGIHFASCSMDSLLARSASVQGPTAAVLFMSVLAKPWDVDTHPGTPSTCAEVVDSGCS